MNTKTTGNAPNAAGTESARAEDPTDAPVQRGILKGRSTRLASLGMQVERLLLVAALIGLWQLAAQDHWVNPTFIGRPSQVWSHLASMEHSGQLWSQTYATMYATLIAFAISIPMGTIIGLALGASRHLDKLLGPFLVPLNTLPRIAFVPLFIVWFGLTAEAKIALAASLSIFIMIFSARAAVRSVDTDQMTLCRTLGISGIGIALKLILPSAVPSLFTGIRLALTYSLLGVVSSEMIAAKDGLGQVIVFYGNNLDISGIVAVVLILAIIAAIIAILFDILERFLLRWQ